MSFLNRIRNNIYINLVARIIIVLILFTLCRLIFYFLNYKYFNDITFFELIKIFLAGLKFDIAAICMINLPWIFFQIIPFNFRFNKLYQKINNILFLFVNGIAIFINCIDVAYFDYTIKRTTADIFITKGLAKDVIHLLPTFLIDFWYILLLAFLLILAMIYLNNFFTKTLKKLNNTFISFIIQFSLAIFFLILTVIGGRGGIQLRPLNIISAGKYTQAKNIPLVINTPFAILNTLGKHSIKKYNFYNEKELNEIFYPIKTVKTNLKFKNYNIVIIILEGFSSEHIGFLNKHLDNGSYKGYTPFLDSLMEHSVVFTNAYANGKKSNEGIAAIIAGIPSLMDVPYSSSIYAGNNIEGIGTLLKKKGYNTSFFHGGNNGTMGFDAFTKTAGFDKYYGKNEYPGNDYDGNWGIWDEEYLQYYANMLDKMEQPFLSAVFTLSSHHPFKIPSKYEGKFLKGPLPIHQTIQYTDFALKKFFNTISSKSWFENTIFILTADHTSEAYFPYYKTRLGMYKVPIIIYNKNIEAKIYSHIVQHIDIVPTILDLVNYDEDYYALGCSVYDTTVTRFAVNYLNNTFQYIEDEYTLLFDGEKTINLYNFVNDSLLQKNIKDIDTETCYKLEKKLKAFLQVFSRDLQNNAMIVKNIKK